MMRRVPFTKDESSPLMDEVISGRIKHILSIRMPVIATTWSMSLSLVRRRGTHHDSSTKDPYV